MTPCHTCRLRYASLALQWQPRRELAARQAERGTCARPTLIWVMQNTQESNAAAGRAAVFMRSPADSQKSVQPTVPTTCSRHGESANGWFVKLRIAPPVNEQLRATYSNLQQLRASYSSSPGAGNPAWPYNRLFRGRRSPRCASGAAAPRRSCPTSARGRR